MKKVSILAIAALSAGFILSSCSKKEEAAPAKTPADNKQTMSSVTTTAQTDIKELVATPGVKAIASFSSASSKADPFSSTKSGGQSILIKTLTPESLINLIYDSKTKSALQTSSERFDFAGSSGTYTWKAATKQWGVEKNITNKIVVNFPSDTTKTTNDAVLTISKYSDVLIGYSYEVTAMEANVTVAGTEALSLSMTAAYSSSGLPTQMSLSLGVNPFSFNIKYADGGASQSLATSLKNADKVLFGIEGTINYLDATKAKLVSISGIVLTYRDLQLKGDAKVDEMITEVSKSKDTTVTAQATLINKYCVFAMYRTDDGTKMGDIAAVKSTDGTLDFNIKYSDTESESLKTYGNKIKDAVSSDLASLQNIIGKAL